LYGLQQSAGVFKKKLKNEIGQEAPDTLKNNNMKSK